MNSRALQAEENGWVPRLGDKVQVFISRAAEFDTPPVGYEGRVGEVTHIDTRYRAVAVRFSNDVPGAASTLNFETYWLIQVAAGGVDVVGRCRDEQEVDAALRFFAILKWEKLPSVVAWGQLLTISQNKYATFLAGISAPPKALMWCGLDKQ